MFMCIWMFGLLSRFGFMNLGFLKIDYEQVKGDLFYVWVIRSGFVLYEDVWVIRSGFVLYGDVLNMKNEQWWDDGGGGQKRRRRWWW
ncbi:hypothetical protein HanPSC8_Chr13g0566561 [Helianthus annuus]|nr:hypothetical protein HanPSC8_Chr13g0566561 [Helianthus annuus]